MHLRPAAYAVVLRDEEILLSHWRGFGSGSGAWTLPGGGLDPGEHPEDGAIREVFEETGYHVRLTGLLAVDSFVVPASDRRAGSGAMQGIRILYRGEVVSGELTIEIGGSSDDAAWVTLADVPRLHRSSHVDLALERMRAQPAGMPLATRS